MSIAIVFPGQGTQHRGWARRGVTTLRGRVIDEAEAAFGEPLAHLVLDAPAETLARTREAQLAVLLTSLVAWEAVRDSIDRARRVRRATRSVRSPRSSRRACCRSTRACASRPGGPSSPRPRPTRTRAAWPRCSAPPLEQAEDACAAAPDACWVANDNAPGQVVIAGTPDGRRGRQRPRQGARREARDAPQRRWRVPHPAHARRGRRAAGRARDA